MFPAKYQGAYFYGDYVRNWIRYLTFDPSGEIVTGDFGFQPLTPRGIIMIRQHKKDGALYYSTDSGELLLISYISTGKSAPSIDLFTSNQLSGPIGSTITFNVIASDQDKDKLTFRWIFGDGEEIKDSTATTVSRVYRTTGKFYAIVIVSDGEYSVTSDPILVSIGVESIPVKITSPPQGQYFKANDIIKYNAAFDLSNSKATQAVIAEQARSGKFAWSIYIKHNEHLHPILENEIRQSGEFQVPASGHEFNREISIIFVVKFTNKDQITSTHQVEVLPTLAVFSLSSIPNGINIVVDGIPRQTPYEFETMLGFEHFVQPEESICMDSQSLAFDTWSDGGAKDHWIEVGKAAMEVTVNYSIKPYSCLSMFSNDRDLVMWLKHDSIITGTGGSTVSKWEDVSRYHNDLSVSSTAVGQQGKSPKLSTSTFSSSSNLKRNTVTFKGTSNFLSLKGINSTQMPSGTQDRSVFMYTRYRAGSNMGINFGSSLTDSSVCSRSFGSGVLDVSGVYAVLGSCTNDRRLSTAFGTKSGWILHSIILKNDVASIYVNQKLVGTFSVAKHTAPLTDIALGALSQTSALNPRQGEPEMEVAEVMLFNRVVTQNEHTLINDYFSGQFGKPRITPQIRITSPTRYETVNTGTINVQWSTLFEAADVAAGVFESIVVSLGSLPSQSFKFTTPNSYLNGMAAFSNVGTGNHTVSVSIKPKIASSKLFVGLEDSMVDSVTFMVSTSKSVTTGTIAATTKKPGQPVTTSKQTTTTVAATTKKVGQGVTASKPTTTTVAATTKKAGQGVTASKPTTTTTTTTTTRKKRV